MEKFEILFSNKKSLITMAIIYVIVVVTVLIFIWKPENVPDIAKYKPYDETEKSEEMLTYYLGFIADMKDYYSADVFEKYMNYNYLKRTNTTYEEALDLLKETNKNYSLKNFSLYKYGDNFIYSVILPNGGDGLKLNIVEDGYPYDFYITYGTFVKYSDMLKYGQLDGAKARIIGTYNDINYIEYELEITNEQDSELTLDLSDINDVYLTSADNSIINLNSIKSTKGKVVINKGETRVVNLAFNLNIDLQNNIQYLNISKILRGNVSNSMKISL